ncbi:MAG: hypothetical protein KA061_10440 [Bacteroidales bacterium]|nr:hypothetical protein [Bacteroidales bacterium]
MNKHLLIVKATLDKKKAGISARLAQASITPEDKTKLDAAMTEIEAAIKALEDSAEDATIEQITAIFSKAVETLSSVSDVQVAQEMEAMQAKIEAQLIKLQAKIEVGSGAGKKFSARLDHKLLKAAAKDSEGYRHYSAGVDATAWTPEATIEDIEIFHPLIGVAAGFTVSTTSTTAIKLRKFGVTGSAAFVANHGVKPLIEMVGSQNVVNVTTIAGIVEGIADEDLEDNTGLQTEVQQEALENLAQFENTSAIALLESQSQAYANVSFGTKAGADEKTAIVAVIDAVRQKLGNRQSAIVLAMNSSQWAKLMDLRNANGTPIDIATVLGDVEKVVDNGITGDNFYCYAKKFANIKIYKGKTAEWYKGVKVVSAEGAVTAVYSEWRTDEQSLRVRQRQVMYISDSSVFFKGSISGVVTAITPLP